MNKLLIPILFLVVATATHAMDLTNPANPLNPFNPFGIYTKKEPMAKSCQIPKELGIQKRVNLVLDIVKFQHDPSKKYSLELFVCSKWLCGGSVFRMLLNPSESKIEGSRTTLLSDYDLGCVFSRKPNDGFDRFTIKVEEITDAFSLNKTMGKNSVFITDLAKGPMQVILDEQGKIQTRMFFE